MADAHILVVGSPAWLAEQVENGDKDAAKLEGLVAGLAAAKEAAAGSKRPSKARKLSARDEAAAKDVTKAKRAVADQQARIKENDDAYARAVARVLRERFGDRVGVGVSAEGRESLDKILEGLRAQRRAHDELASLVEVHLENANAPEAALLAPGARASGSTRKSDYAPLVPAKRDGDPPLGVVELTCPNCRKRYWKNFKALYDATKLSLDRGGAGFSQSCVKLDGGCEYQACVDLACFALRKAFMNEDRVESKRQKREKENWGVRFCGAAGP